MQFGDIASRRKICYRARMDIDFSTFVAAIFAGNLLTAAFLWGMSRASRYKSDAETPWLVLGAIALPLLFLLGSFYLNLDLPPPLAALAAQ